jgi:hypothetical protein
MRYMITAAFAAAFACQANAQTVVPMTDLPSEIQGCFASGTCSTFYTTGTDIISLFNTDTSAAFQYQDSSVDKWLLRYQLMSPPGTISGYAWLSAQNSYDISGGDAHAFNLYYSGSAFYSTTALTLTLNDLDLASGSSFRLLVPDFEDDTQSIDEGSLLIDPADGVCLATGCGFEATFNLLDMKYVDGSFSFDASNSRGLLFDAKSWYDCGGTDCGSFAAEDSLRVSAVPLPAAIWLFGSGLLGVGAMARRKLPD